MARNAKWEVAVWSPAADVTSAALSIGLTGVAVPDRQTMTLISADAVDAVDREHITVLRTIGHIRYSTQTAAGGSGATALCKARLHTGMQTDIGGVTAFVYDDDLFSFEGAEEDFMWENTFSASGFAPAAGTRPDYPGTLDSGSANPFWVTIDSKVKRTLRFPECLGLTVAAHGNATDVLRVWAWIRLYLAV